METASDGTETQTQIVPSSKPRPPAVAKKPKPSIPKKPEKPSVTQKPTAPPRQTTLNGDGQCHSQGEVEPLSDTHTVRETLVTEKLIPHINDSTNHQASAPARRTTPEKPVLARPKEPPPPLPKTPPKGPATRKTPPTLPKHPPKGQGGLPSSSDSKLQSDKLDISAVKPIVKSRSFTDTDIKASEADSNSREIKNNTDLNEGNEDKSPQKTKWNFREHKSPKAPPGVIKPKPRRKTIDTVQTKSDHSQHSEEVNRNKTPALERGISIGNSTWFNASLDEADEKSSKKLSSDSAKHLSTESDDKTIVKPTVIQRATSVGKSTFFVEPDNLCDENDLADVQSNLIENVKEGIETDEEHKKLEESGVSAHPAPVRTPPPVPKKIIHKVSIPSTHTASSPEPGHSDINSATNSHKQSFSCDNKGGSGVNEETPSKAIKPDSAINEKAKSYQPSTKPRRSLTPADSLENQPKPVPRKPIPTVKPRPVPKKRSTKKRHSGSEEFILSQSVSGSVDNLPLQCNLDAVDKNLSTNERSGEEVSERITKTSADGEEKQYRVIDKSVLGASNQNTALEKAGNKTALDVRKISPERSLESDQALTVVELRKKFKESKSADTSNHAQVNVPNINKNDSQKVKVASDKKELNSSSNDHTPSSLKSSFEDLLADKSILEPSSLLNEIEEILSRSYKHSSLTRSGSSPEKRGISVYRDSLDVRTERSQSLDLGSDQKTSTPIRPPRPKKEAKAKRLRSQSQIVYDTCASDTESLPDLSITREEQFLSLKDDFSKTLGPARPHPPKPKRNKLLKVQRSHSDITKMKSFLDQKEMEGNKISPHKRQLSDFSPVLNNGDAKSPGQLKGIGPQGNSVSTDQSNMSRARRPTRKAPPPPIKIVTKTPSTDLNIVVPVDTRVKSKNLEKKSLKRHSLEDSSGSIYDSINDQEVPYSSDEDHDYHEIPEHLRQGKGNSDSRSKSGSPPKLPPRNYSSSNSFDSSSQSGFVCDISIVDGASSVEDLSVSSAMLKPDSGSRTNSPSLKRPQISKPLPSPLLHRKLEEIQSLDRSGLSGSNLSIPESLDGSVGSRTRPVSNASEMTVTSSESEGEDEATKAQKKKEKKLYLIAQEVVSSERIFVDVLKLLNVDFRMHISAATENHGRPVIPSETLNRILDYLPQLQNFNEELLKDLEERLGTWDTKRGIADIFVKKGPFLKLYTSYIRDFETMTATLDEAVKKHTAFQAALKEFELSPRCASLALRHYMLKPIQRIPQYRLLLQDYMKHLPADSPEMKDMQTALIIVSEVAEHANENMRHGDYVQKMLEIQRSLIGQFEVIKPGRIFLKEGELMKLSRKEMQPRFFFLFNDVLLYTTPVATGYKLNNVLPLAGMKVSVSGQDDFKNEFSIVSVQRSFTVAGSTLEERDDWVHALNSAIEENAMKRNTFEAVRAGTQDLEVLLDKDFVLGHKPPIWIPDSRVTMCMLCTCEFTVTWRRHHCRACGRVVCGNCSDCKAQLRYLKYKEGRVCEECFKILSQDKGKEEEGSTDHQDGAKEGDDSWLSINGLFERFGKIRLSGRADKKLVVHRPKVLTEVTANDQGASMSGYLQKLHKAKKWKKMWFVLKDKVLYQFKATQDQAAMESTVLLGYEVVRFTEFYEGVDPGLLFQLSHSNTAPIVFRTDSASATEKWVTVMREASVA